MAAAVAVLLVVAIVALRAAQASPPALAEFAPQAQTIKEAPQEQTATLGRAPGGLAPGAATPAPSPSLPPDAVFRQCVGDPPRQIEDPQSPPCVPYWHGSNGGATWKGVSDATITVGLAANQYVAPLSQDLIDFFNKRFEFYGRHLVLRQYTSSSSCATSATPCGSPTSMYTDAAALDKLGIFGVLGYGQGGNDDGSDYYFFDQLAQRQIVSVDFSDKEGAPFVDQAHYDQFAPYEWSYLPSLDQDLSSMGSFICTQLAGRPPSYAGAPTSAAPARKFGLLVETYSTQLQPNLQPLLSEASACGQPFTVVNYQPTQQGEVNALLQLKVAGATSILCVCQVNTLTDSMFPAATSQQYFPEWLITNFGVQDDDFLMAFYGENTAPQQTAHVFGLMGFNKWMAGANMPVSWAVEDVDPAQGCPRACFNWEVWAEYWDLLVLASGIQMAGPNLTPAALQQGLFRTPFPNPNCGAAPYYQACVGFGPHDHTMIQDYAMVWWSPTAREQFYFEGQTQPGAYCYIGLGTRFRQDWPRTREPLFDQTKPCQ